MSLHIRHSVTVMQVRLFVLVPAREESSGRPAVSGVVDVCYRGSFDKLEVAWAWHDERASITADTLR